MVASRPTSSIIAVTVLIQAAIDLPLAMVASQPPGHTTLGRLFWKLGTTRHLLVLLVEQLHDYAHEPGWMGATTAGCSSPHACASCSAWAA